MSTPELRATFENELWRVLIQNHANFPAWYSQLDSHARQVLDNILEADVTPELIQFSQAAPENTMDSVTFVAMIAGGNPSPQISLELTNLVLRDILFEVREFTQP